MKHGLFVNSSLANCSIYESGVMIKDALRSNKYRLDYIELARRHLESNYKLPEYDFYVINWHHITLPAKRDYINALPGLKIGIVLEVDGKPIFPSTPMNIFDAYMPIDPTAERIGHIYPFPRPLETADKLLPLLREDILVIGSFGFQTPGKNWDKLIKVYADNGKEVMIRINIPFATYALTLTETVAYCKYLRSLATKNIDLQVTNNYMSKQELITWCSQNTINAFLYYRDQPGLSATTDQCISARRAIGITSCYTFRHMQKYIGTYPEQSFEQLAVSTLPGVSQMEKDWTKESFRLKFEQLLVEERVL